MPTAWEYARLSFAFGQPAKDKPEQGHVAFTHHGEGWEIPEGEVWETLRRLGDEAWELVTKTDFPPDASGEGGYEMYFKRPIAG
jgi:hypothetical protein